MQGEESCWGAFTTWKLFGKTLNVFLSSKSAETFSMLKYMIYCWLALRAHGFLCSTCIGFPLSVKYFLCQTQFSLIFFLARVHLNVFPHVHL